MESNGDLISRSALGIGRCNPDAFPEQNRGYVAGWNGVIALIENAPAVDAVEVVRCKDCKHTGTDGCGAIYCEKWDRWEIPEDFFCGYGKRRDDDGK